MESKGKNQESIVTMEKRQASLLERLKALTEKAKTDPAALKKLTDILNNIEASLGTENQAAEPSKIQTDTQEHVKNTVRGIPKEPKALTREEESALKAEEGLNQRDKIYLRIHHLRTQAFLREVSINLMNALSIYTPQLRENIQRAEAIETETWTEDERKDHNHYLKQAKETLPLCSFINEKFFEILDGETPLNTIKLTEEEKVLFKKIIAPPSSLEGTNGLYDAKEMERRIIVYIFKDGINLTQHLNERIPHTHPESNIIVQTDWAETLKKILKTHLEWTFKHYKLYEDIQLVFAQSEMDTGRKKMPNETPGAILEVDVPYIEPKYSYPIKATVVFVDWHNR